MKKLLLLALALPLASVAWAAPGVSGPVTLTTPGPVTAFAADGNRAAFTVRQRGRWQILVWEPAAHRLLTIHTESDTDPNGTVALAGTRVAWDEWYGGLTIATRVSSATLARHAPVSLGSDDGTDYPTGGEVLRPSGDGKLLAFTEDYRCEDFGSEPDCPPGRKTGDIVHATIWRAAPRGACPTGSANDFRRVGHCARVATANGRLTVLDVDAGRIAARTDHGVTLFTGAGGRLLDVPIRNVNSAALSGNRLVVRVPGSFQIYDSGSGELVKTIPAQSRDRLEDLASGILVTANGKTVTLRRLPDGKTARFQTSGYARARLERPGLFVAGARRVTFTPMAAVLRRLGS